MQADFPKSQFTSIHAWPPGLLRAFRFVRHAALVALGPLDYLNRVIHGRRRYPPISLRRHVGALRTFGSSGAEFLTYLRLLIGLRPDESILDVGCGCGLMALVLEDFMTDEGRYVGIDIHKPSIAWCRKKLASRRRNFQFIQIDKSQALISRSHPDGNVVRFPCADGTFDVILLKSVFTHMRIAEIDNYLSEIARVLGDGGRCLATFFLLNERQSELRYEGLNQLAFEFGDDISRYVYKHSPESATAHREDLILELLAKHRLTLMRPVIYGTWSGLRDGLSFQDMLLIERRRA